nr:hypothetical protein OG999_10055 [Streptomyces sp. NBC_00886]
MSGRSAGTRASGHGEVGITASLGILPQLDGPATHPADLMVIGCPESPSS